MPACATTVCVASRAPTEGSVRGTLCECAPFKWLVVLLLSEPGFTALGGRENSINGWVFATATLITVVFAGGTVAASSLYSRRQVPEKELPVRVARDGAPVPKAFLRNHLPCVDVDRTDLRLACAKVKGKAGPLLQAVRQLLASCWPAIFLRLLDA